MAIGIIISRHIKREEQQNVEINDLAKQIEKRDKTIEKLEEDNEIAKRDKATEKLKTEEEIKTRDETIKKLENEVAEVKRSYHKITTALSHRYLLERFPHGVKKWTKDDREEVGWEASLKRIRVMKNLGNKRTANTASLELVNCKMSALAGLYDLLSEEIHKFRSKSGVDFDPSHWKKEVCMIFEALKPTVTGGTIRCQINWKLELQRYLPLLPESHSKEHAEQVDKK
ncbi:hypothetical protein B0T22DRAFT_449815 [Podospora appendiculata]|uniref:Uncharacterized protein n=1 Tax=Podospora appendiculata TaxID=314037 RepID=A0AAE0XHG3_9PEZI|nr:hypothetical protein B0T22DRAFT_449815 [Podospora appendiculata]